MVDQFHKQIQKAIRNTNLQAALDQNALSRISVHQQAMSLLPDLQERRQRAHTVRAEVIANLNYYLDHFIQKVSTNGISIHRAADASQAVKIVLDIAQECQARLIAKSKTMVSEEIKLNDALEAAGIRVVETDLGEYIVQLRGEHPGHIITPAVHLRRGDVGQTFHEKLGIPLTDDVPILTNTARHMLREVFLSADIGISGVNFGVAETGTLCIFTNEGNGRMVTTIPPVHIAIMGTERLVPTLEDLSLMMSLLPRASTGQKLTVYVSLIHRPWREGDPDGPVERHLVLVDNRRGVIKDSSLAESLYCIRCGACLNACPVFREIGGHAYVNREGEGSPYSGPIGSVISPAIFGQWEYGQLARASSLCGACREACPVDIDLPKLLLRVRAGGQKIEMKHTPTTVPISLNLGLKMFAWMAVSSWRFRLAQKMAAILSRMLSPRSDWLRLPNFTGWGITKDFPRPSYHTFREWMKTRSEDKTRSSELAKMPTQKPAKLADMGRIVQPDLVERIARFQVELEALEGNFIQCQEYELVEKISKLLNEKGISKVMTWDAAFLPLGLLKALQERGIFIQQTPDPDALAGITGCLAGVSETATLLLPGGPGHPLTASLLPQIHIAILRENDVYQTMEEALLLPEVRSAPVVALISGPSRTADIEMTLTIGVHGPKEVYVYCVRAPSPIY